MAGEAGPLASCQSLMRDPDTLSAISPQRLLAQQQRAQSQRSVPSGGRQPPDQQVGLSLPFRLGPHLLPNPSTRRSLERPFSNQ